MGVVIYTSPITAYLRKLAFSGAINVIATTGTAIRYTYNNYLNNSPATDKMGKWVSYTANPLAMVSASRGRFNSRYGRSWYNFGKGRAGRTGNRGYYVKHRYPSYRRYPRGRVNKGTRLAPFGFRRKKMLNPISNQRTIRIRQRINIRIALDASTTYGHATETINGTVYAPLKLCVTVQPFAVLALNGTVKPYHSVSAVSDGTNDRFGVFGQAGPVDYNPDWQAICMRYASFCVKSMSVKMTLFAYGQEDTGAAVNQWTTAGETQLVVRSAFDRLDTQSVAPEILPGNAMTAYPTAPDLYQMRRLPYFNEWTQAPFDNFKRPKRTKVLFNRKFTAGKAKQDTILTKGSTSNQAVLAGGWDNRAVYDDAFDNAFEVMNSASTAGGSPQANYRAGKLFIDIRPMADTVAQTWLGTWNGGSGQPDNIGYIETEHVIGLKNDVDAYIPNPPA